MSKYIGRMSKEETFERAEAFYQRKIETTRNHLKDYILEVSPGMYEEDDGTPIPQNQGYFESSGFMRDVRSQLEFIANHERQLEILRSLKED